MTWNPLLDAPAFPAARFAVLADRLRALLRTTADLVHIQAEAIVALEAVAISLARPGVTAINIVTSPYGVHFGHWLERGGATVHHVVAAPSQPITVEAVTAAFDAAPDARILFVIHGEAANGVLNPLPEIAALARSRGAIIVVDAVASVGGERLDVDAMGLDIVVIGPQKALGGPAGLSAVTVNAAAWAMIEAPGGPEDSTLSLTDIKHNWLDKGRGGLPGTVSVLDFWALDAALDRIEAEGIDALVARHRRAAAASRAGIRAMGFEPWILDDANASGLVTGAPVPAGIDADALVAAAAAFDLPFGKGVGDGGEQLVRLNHTGLRAEFAPVLANIVAYGTALAALGHPVDLGAATAAVAAAYAA